MARRDTVAATGAATLVVVLLVGAVVLATTRDRRADPGPPLAEPDTSPVDTAAAAAFLAAWERSRTGTWVVEAEHRQERAGVVVLEGTQRTVQRPPDRLVSQGGSIDGRLDGEVVACAPGPDGSRTCRDGVPAPPYAEEVATELRRLGTYVQGGAPLYTVGVEEGGSCYELTLARAYPVPPYGDRARFCFDPDTGAPVHQEVVRGTVVDATVATAVRTPTPADLVV